MKFLLCNDDGWQALGIQVLSEVLSAKGHQVTVVAPSEERSGQSHAASFFRPILVKHVSPHVWSVHGTPADSAIVGICDVLKNDRPDFVLSGINNGLNVGGDVNYSGTVGAATEATLMGFRSIALSLDTDAVPPEQHRAAYTAFSEWLVNLLPQLQSFPWPEMEVLNINHPGTTPKGVRFAKTAPRSMYIPCLQKFSPDRDNGRTQNLSLFMIGGEGRHPPVAGNEHDTSLVQQGWLTVSFLKARQDSTENTRALETHLKF